MPLLRNIGTLAACRLAGGQAEIHALRNAAMVWDGPVIVWVGPEPELPPQFRSWDSSDAEGKLVIPGLIDCHTHLAFGGWRADEFEQRIRGKSYRDIARAGGGIARTVEQTRKLPAEELTQRALSFLDQMGMLGVTAVECKSGYGLDFDGELKLLTVYKALQQRHPLRIVPTFLGAHAVPPEYKDDRAAYLDLLQHKLIPAIAERQLAKFCDVFVDDTAFTIAEARRILETAKAFGLRPKLHADQLSDGGGAQLAAEVGAVSADHLECVSDHGIQKLAEAGTVTVSLPLAALYLGQRPLPARKLIDAQVPVAVATDFNPGSAPSYHLPLAMLLACTMQRMTPTEVLKGTTIYAAKALGLEHTIGSLEPGKAADFSIIDAPGVPHWLYHFRPNACIRTVVNGATFVPQGSRR